MPDLLDSRVIKRALNTLHLEVGGGDAPEVLGEKNYHLFTLQVRSRPAFELLGRGSGMSCRLELPQALPPSPARARKPA